MSIDRFAVAEDFATTILDLLEGSIHSFPLGHHARLRAIQTVLKEDVLDQLTGPRVRYTLYELGSASAVVTGRHIAALCTDHKAVILTDDGLYHTCSTEGTNWSLKTIEVEA